MAKLEYMKGVRATYFILNTAPYFNPRDKEMWRVLQAIKEMGHEIAWHNNALTEFIQAHAVDNRLTLDSIVRKNLHYFSDNGFKIFGSASHGDHLCHVLKYTNKEIWEDFEKRNNFDYEQLSPGEFDLRYEAYKFVYDFYLSDSGGNWNKEKPIEELRNAVENSVTPIQLLIHCQWWK